MNYPAIVANRRKLTATKGDTVEHVGRPGISLRPVCAVRRSDDESNPARVIPRYDKPADAVRDAGEIIIRPKLLLSPSIQSVCRPAKMTETKQDSHRCTRNHPFHSRCSFRWFVGSENSFLNRLTECHHFPSF